MECRHGKKDWNGDEPKCAFDNKGKFLKDNWNCILMSKLRDKVEANENEFWSDDEHCGIIPYSYGRFIILNYYKHRGETSGFWVIGSSQVRKGSEEDAKEVCGYLEKPRNHIEK